jgi:hypothetical protein
MPRLTENIIVRADPDLKAQVEDFAKRHELTMSALARIALVGIMKEAAE